MIGISIQETEDKTIQTQTQLTIIIITKVLTKCIRQLTNVLQAKTKDLIIIPGL